MTSILGSPSFQPILWLDAMCFLTFQTFRLEREDKSQRSQRHNTTAREQRKEKKKGKAAQTSPDVGLAYRQARTNCHDDWKLCSEWNKEKAPRQSLHHLDTKLFHSRKSLSATPINVNYWSCEKSIKGVKECKRRIREWTWVVEILGHSQVVYLPRLDWFRNTCQV